MTASRGLSGVEALAADLADVLARINALEVAAGSRPGGTIDGDLTVTGTVTTDEGFVWADASGSNANGSWVRLPGGVLVCWDRRTVTDQAIASAYGTIFQGSRSITFPQLFAAIPTVTVGEAKWSTGASWGGTNFADTDTASLRFYDTSSRATGPDFVYSWMAVGLAA